MNWDAIGAIAELLGAIGVIASLVYLATQIRQSREQMSQNTRATRASAYQQFSGLLHGTMMAAGENPQREQAVMRGMTDFSRLSEEDAFRFTWWMTGVAHAFENAYYQYRVGMLDEDRWQHHADVRGLFQNPGIAQWCRAAPPNLSPEFVALVEEILGEEAEQTDRTR
jgi:hypothetical protein